MASVQELLLANEAKKSPFISLMEGAAQGFGNEFTNMTRQKNLMAMEQARQEQARKEKNDKMLRKLASAVNSDTTQKLGATGTPNTPANPRYRLKTLTTDNEGYFKPGIEIVEPKERKAPPGYRFITNGNLEAIPGGPADRKNQMVDEKKAGLATAAANQAVRLREEIKQAKALVSRSTAGLGGVLKNVPGTSAKNLDSRLTTIKANLGFAELQEMRRNSPTGGALGQVAVMELEALQSTVASLDQRQSPEQLLGNLDKIDKHYAAWENAVAKANGQREMRKAVLSVSDMSDEDILSGLEQ